MQMRSTAIFTLLGISVIAVVAYFYWGDPSKKSGKPAGFPPAVIAATEVEATEWQPGLLSVGSLEAINGIDVTTEVDGIIRNIVFASGQTVEKDQVLVELDDSIDQAALEALRAELRLVDVQFKRASDLLKKRVTSKSEYDETHARFDAARARVKQQEAIIRRKIIRAPFSGLAGIRQVDLGEYLEAGRPIVSLQALDPIYVDYTLAERYLTRVKPGQTINVKLDAVPGESFTGKVTAVNSSVDTRTRTIKIRAMLDNPDNVLRPGMFATIETYTDEPQVVLTVPRTAISFNTYGNFVYVINTDDKGVLKVKRTPATTGESREGRVVITGLEAGTQVVRAGLVKLRDGMAVKIDNQVKLDDKEISGK